jgi:hypothetical protein
MINKELPENSVIANGGVEIVNTFRPGEEREGTNGTV